ncbi:MAG: MBL fold metallo-hydrolase [Ruminiclostridium sp.]|nr:MBL fold metallo-hydrolase [Ruminiclostridium sp.]
MADIPYTIISTGSKGNAVVINDIVLIDCGVPFKALTPYYKNLKLVLLTHIHSDHFNKTAIKLLAEERPTLRFACGKWLVNALIECKVPKKNIDVLTSGTIYNYGACNVIQFPLSHDVPNCGWKVHFPIGKVIYATDTNNMNGVSALNYDLYLIEANYIDEEIEAKIREKKAAGEYAYEIRAQRYHQSKARCDDFIYRNIGRNGKYEYMHCHKDEDENDEG